MISPAQVEHIEKHMAQFGSSHVTSAEITALIDTAKKFFKLRGEVWSIVDNAEQFETVDEVVEAVKETSVCS